MSVYLHGQFNRTGIGVHCENIFHALSRMSSERILIRQVDPATSADQRQGGQVVPRGVHLFFRRESLQYRQCFPGRHILWWVFESDRLPAKWLVDVAAYDEIWVPSAWARGVLLHHGMDPVRVRVVELGVATDVFKPRRESHDGFVLLSVGKYEKRKSITEIIEAFVAEFPENAYPQVKLWLKADYPLYPQRILDLTQRVSFDPRILAVTGDATPTTMAKLYGMADAFVFPSRAEGFGLPCIEALASGVPLIATNVSGQTAFLSAVRGLYLPITFDEVPIVDEDYAYFYGRDYGAEPWGSWAQPQVASIRYGMRELYEHQSMWRSRALDAATVIHALFSWDTIARKVLQALA